MATSSSSFKQPPPPPASSPTSHSSHPRQFTRRLVSFEDKVIQIDSSSRTENNNRSASAEPKARRRSFLGGSRESFSKRLPKNINSNLLYSTSPTVSLSSSDYVKHDRRHPVASNPARHSIAVAPMAYRKAATNTTIQTQGPPQLHLITNQEFPEEQASICHSPTWADEKNKKKSSGWAWRKNSQGKTKKEEQIDQQNRPGRRLNKKPPPAMETQRQSASLANGVGGPESLYTERRPSSSGSLTKAMKGFLSRRSSQGSVSDASRPPSVKALRSQSQEPKARESTQPLTGEKVKYEEDEAYVNDIADFVNQMEASARAALDQPVIQQSSAPQSATFPATPPHSPGQESPQSADPKLLAKQNLPRSTSVPASISRIFGKRDNAAGGYKYPNLGNKNMQDKLANGQKADQGSWLNRNFGSKSSGTPTNQPETSISAGYVQRQRLVQQQRSIVGFQDEMAVKSAYDQFINESQLPPTPQESTESVQTSTEARAAQAPQQPIPNHTRAPNTSPPNGTISWKPLPPPKSVGQIKALPSPEMRPLPAIPPQVQKKPSMTSVVTSTNQTRPQPQAIQSSNYESYQTQSTPNVPQITRSQPIETSRQSKESTLTMASSSTGTSNSSVSTQKIPPTYQLPPLTSSQTSPMFPAFSEPSSEAISPPALNLNDNSVRLVPTETGKDLPKPPLPKTTITASANNNELLVASENAEGIVRKTSIKRHRSDPELKVPGLKVETSKPDLPSLDFLPELRHQAFTKPKRISRTAFPPGSPTQPPLSPSQFPIPSPSTEVARRPVGQMRASKRSSVIGSGAVIGTGGMPPKPIAKLFVICCQCKFWHDLPSKLYEAMALPQAVGREDDIAGGVHQNHTGTQNTLADGEVKGFQGKIFTQVKCPWCPHCLSTSCCQGWTAITYLHERHH